MNDESSTAEMGMSPETLTPTSIPSSFALFQEGNKISHQDNLPFKDTVAQLRLPFAGIFTEASIRIDRVNELSGTQKVKLALYSTAHELQRNTSPEAQQRAFDVLVSEPELRTDILVASKKEESHEFVARKNNAFLRDYGGKALEKRTADGKITTEQGVHIALAFQSVNQNLSAAEKAFIINAIIDPSAELPPHLQSLASSVLSHTKTYETIYKSILATLPTRDKRTGLIAYSSLAGSALTAFSVMGLCRDKERMFQYFGSEKKGSHVPHEISKLTDVIEIARNNPSITTVSFDLYDTLVQWTSNQGERRGQMNQLATHILNNKFNLPITVEKFRDAAERAWGKRWNEYQQHGAEVDIKDTLGWMVDDVAQIKDPQQRLEAISELEKLWYKVELDTSARMPGAEVTLKTLKEMGKKICLTSNASWSEAHISRVLKKFGLEQYFDQISTSIEHGKMKHPTIPDFFHFSWGKTGATPDQVLHVGDNPWADFDGARFAGAKATRYNNPDSFVDIETNPYYWENPTEYSKKAYEYFRRQQNKEALATINSLLEKKGISPEEQERVKTMAKEVYQKSRDVIGPAYAALGHELLQKLSNGESDAILCLARDGLPMAIVQKLLLHLEPNRYPNAKPEQIRYVHASRKMLDRIDVEPSFREKYLQYLNNSSLSRAQKVTLTDLLCASGRTHEGIRSLLPQKQVDGYYIDIHTDTSPTAHSFLKDSLGDSSAWLVAENMLLLMEALYSGPLQSASDIKNGSNGLGPKLEKKSLPADVLTNGLSEKSLLLFNHLAIMGIQDSVRSLHRKRLLQMTDPPNKETMQRYYAFISSQPTPIWQDVWRGIPWYDNGKWHNAVEVEKEGAVKMGKI